MKNIVSFSLVVFVSTMLNLNAQEFSNNLKEISANHIKHNPIYDVSENLLNNVDTIPDYDNKPNKLKISGTIFQSDGKTPAKDVVLFIYQPDENGEYDIKKDANKKRYIYHRAWVKTDAEGHYTFYTFMPGKYLRSKELKQIHRVIKEPGKAEYDMASFFFNDDPLIPELTLACRAKAVQSMLRIEEENGMLVANKNIKLRKDTNLNQ